MKWDKENGAFVEYHVLTNKQVCGICFFKYEDTNRVLYSTVFAVANKKKKLNGYLFEKDNRITLMETGRCNIEALMWAKNSILNFIRSSEPERNKKTKVVVQGEDARRQRVYERALRRYGFKKEQIYPFGMAMVMAIN